MTIRPLHRLGRKVLIGGGALLLGWTGSGPLAAQPPANPPVAAANLPAVQRNYLNKNVIHLPINQLDEAARARILEIQLHVKDNPAAAWKLKDSVTPAQKGFNFQAPRDGEYWFTMVTVDRQGHTAPSDLRNEPPALIVVIDTQPPQVELTNLGTVPEGQLIQCDAQDLNMDNGQTVVFYQGGDQQYRPADAVPGRPNVFCIPVQAVTTGMVRATAQDLAKNITTREVHINKMASRTAAAPPQQQQFSVELVPPTAEMKTVLQFPPTSFPKQVTVAPPASTEPLKMPARPDGHDGPRLVSQTSGSSPIVQPPTAPTQPASNIQRTEHQEPLKRQFVNSTRVFLDYQIENVGVSGVGRIEVWITSDRSKSWRKLSEDTQRKSPVEVQFPGDGLFGVTLVACNGRGAGATPPKDGDAPDWWIEVDTTKPAAQLTKVQVDFDKGQSFVHIHWSAQDKNLGDAPAELLYAATPQGPWLTIASGLKGDGYHRWSPPAEIGVQAYIRLSVHDVAGNTSIVHSQPVLFDDPARPRAVIRGISVGRPSH